MDDILKQNIIRDLGIDSLPEKEQEEALLTVGDIIFKGIIIKAMDLLSEADKDEFEKVLEKSEENAVLDFLKSKIPNLDDLVKEEIAMFKQSSLDLMRKIKE